MPKYDNRMYHSNRSTHNRENYRRRLLYDSERDEHPVRPHSRSRSESRHSRHSSDSDQRALSQAFLKDLCTAASLSELEKLYPKEVADFRAGMQPAKNYDPYHLTPLPVLTLTVDIAEEIRNSQRARHDVRLEDPPALTAAKDALREAELRDYAAQARLEAVQEQLKKLGSSYIMDSPIKVVLIGDAGVGKSCLIIRYCKGVFEPSHYSTIGIDFHLKRIPRPDGSLIPVQVYDTAGQERFRTMSKGFYRQAHAVIFAYDNTDESSFKHLRRWLDEVDQLCPAGSKRLIMGNKADITSVIEPEMVQAFSRLAGAKVVQVSAKTGENVDEAFSMLIEEVLKDPPRLPGGGSLHPETNKGYCCAL